MATDKTGLPSDAGTVTDPPPTASETNPGQEPSSASEQTHSAEDIDEIKRRWQHDRSEKDRMYQEQQRLYQENLGLRQMVQQQAQRPQPQQQQSAPDDGLSDDEYRELSNAIIEGDPRKIRHWEGIRASRVAQQSSQRVLHELNQMATHGQRIQSSLQYLGQIPEMNDARSPFYQKTVARYQQMLNDPTYSFVAPDQHPIGPGQFINPHIMRLAALETEKELKSTRAEGQEVARSAAEHFTEPSGRSAPPATKEFNPMKHLSPEERAYVDKQRNRLPDYNYKKYWETMDQPMRDARLKSGKAMRRVKNTFIE